MSPGAGEYRPTRFGTGPNTPFHPAHALDRLPVDDAHSHGALTASSSPGCIARGPARGLPVNRINPPHRHPAGD